MRSSFLLLRRHTALIDSSRRFGTTLRVHLQEGTRYVVPKRPLLNIPEERGSENAKRSPVPRGCTPLSRSYLRYPCVENLLLAQRLCTQISCQSATLRLLAYYFRVKTTQLRLINGCRKTLHSIRSNDILWRLWLIFSWGC